MRDALRVGREIARHHSLGVPWSLALLAAHAMAAMLTAGIWWQMPVRLFALGLAGLALSLLVMLACRFLWASEIMLREAASLAWRAGYDAGRGLHLVD